MVGTVATLLVGLVLLWREADDKRRRHAARVMAWIRLAAQAGNRTRGGAHARTPLPRWRPLVLRDVASAAHSTRPNKVRPRPRSAPVPGISGRWSLSNCRAGTSAARGALAGRGPLPRTAAGVDSAVESPGAQSRKASAGQLMMMLADPSGSPPGAVTTPRAASSNTFSASVFSPLRPAATAASL